MNAYAALAQLLRNRPSVRVEVKYAPSADDCVDRTRLVSAKECFYYGGRWVDLKKRVLFRSCFTYSDSSAWISTKKSKTKHVVAAMKHYDHLNDLTITRITTPSGKTVLWRARS